MRIFLFLALLPLLIAVVIRQLRWGNIAKAYASHRCRIKGADLARRLLPEGKVDLPRELAQAEDAPSLGRVLLLVGRAMLEKSHPEPVKARRSLERFGLAAPPFALMVLVFAVVLAKMHVFTALTMVLILCALAVVGGFTMLNVDRQAVFLAIQEMRKSNAVPAEEDEQMMERCAEAAVWREILPASLGWLAGE